MQQAQRVLGDRIYSVPRGSHQAHFTHPGSGVLKVWNVQMAQRIYLQANPGCGDNFLLFLTIRGCSSRSARKMRLYRDCAFVLRNIGIHYLFDLATFIAIASDRQSICFSGVGARPASLTLGHHIALLKGQSMSIRFSVNAITCDATF